MCACRCGIRVHLRDGEVRYIDGNPDHPINRGVICAKGSSGIMKQYSPARLTQPLAPQGGRRARRRRVRAHLLGRGVRDPGRAPRAHPRRGPEEVRAVHRPRPDAGADGPVRAPVRHAQLRRARRLLLGEHGRRHDLHDRRLVLGVRRPRPRAREAVRDDRHRRGPSLQPAQDRDLQVQARRRTLRLDQSDTHRLFGDRRRVGADQARHRRRAPARAHPRAHRDRAVRPRFPCALHQRRPARELRRQQRRVRPHGARRREPGSQPDVPAEQAVVGPRDEPAGGDPHARCRPVPVRRTTRCRTACPSSPPSRCSRSACATARRNGRRASPAFPPRRSAGWRTRWASPRATRRSSCRFPGPIRGVSSTRP